MRKLFHSLHLWLSIPVGIIISIICLKGAILVCEQEIKELASPKLYKVEIPENGRMLKPSELKLRINERMGDSLQISSIVYPGKEGRACTVSFRNMGRKYLSVNPYDGNVNGWIESSEFFLATRRLHRWMMNPPEVKGEMSVGKYVVGISTLVLVVILMSGLVIWVPRNRRALKNRLTVSFSKGWRRFWYDSHVAWGFYSTLLLLVMALTGLTWSFGWFRSAAYSLVGANNKTTEQHSHHNESENKGKRSDKDKTEITLVWDNVLAGIQERYDEYSQITFQRDMAFVGTNIYTSMRKNDKVYFDAKSGEITSVTKYSETPMAQKAKGIFYALHTGSWGGIITKILYFLACVIGAVLPLSGYYLWIKKMK